MPHPPHLAPLVQLHEGLGQAIERVVLAPLDVDVDEREIGFPAPRVERRAEPRKRDAQRPPAWRVEPAAVTEHLADLLVLPGRELLEHVELVDGEADAAKRATQLARSLGDVSLLGQASGLVDVARGQLEPELGGLMDDLEEQLVAVHPFAGTLLQREQLLGSEVALVVAGSVAREDRGVEILVLGVHWGEHTGPVSDLFSDAATGRAASVAPLPQRIRPRTLDELVGQGGVLGPGTALRRAIEDGRSPSMILHGPPGVGKTTIARIVAEASSAVFEELSAVSARVDDVRGVLGRARERLGANGLRTLLFIDEIHRFDKRQQDSVLHAVEEGLVTLIGATTENPYFEVNQALLSRCTVIELEPLSQDELEQVVERGARELEVELSPEVVSEIARRAGGDARTALQTLELAWETAQATGAQLDVSLVDDVGRKRPLRYDRAGDRHYDLTSAFIKSMRGSDPDAAVYYLAAMLEGGEDPRFLARRIVIAASEDVGNADPQALVVAVAAAQALEHVGLPEAQLNLAQAAIYVARAPKSNASARAIWDARADVRRDGIGEPPAALRDAHYRGAATRGHGSGYVSPHDDPARAAVDHLPESLRGRTYYVASGNGEEGDGGDRDG